MMKIRRDFEGCESSAELVKVVLQNVMLDLLEERGLKAAIDRMGYMNREPLENSLEPGAPYKKVARSMIDMCRYFRDCEPEFFQELGYCVHRCLELAVIEVGDEVSAKDLECYGREFKEK